MPAFNLRYNKLSVSSTGSTSLQPTVSSHRDRSLTNLSVSSTGSTSLQLDCNNELTHYVLKPFSILNRIDFPTTDSYLCHPSIFLSPAFSILNRIDFPTTTYYLSRHSFNPSFSILNRIDFPTTLSSSYGPTPHLTLSVSSTGSTSLQLNPLISL